MSTSSSTMSTIPRGQIRETVVGMHQPQTQQSISEAKSKLLATIAKAKAAKAAKTDLTAATPMKSRSVTIVPTKK